MNTHQILRTRAGGKRCLHSAVKAPAAAWIATSALALPVLLLAGCAAPIGADRVSTRQAYAQVEANALRGGKPSADTVSILHRYDLDRLVVTAPDEAVRRLQAKAVARAGLRRPCNAAMMEIER